MKERRGRTGEPVRTRVLFHALVGALSVSSALILRDTSVGSQRAGALLLLLGGALFLTVGIIDSVRSVLKRHSKPESQSETHGDPVATEPTVTRRIRAPRPEIQPAQGGERLP